MYNSERSITFKLSVHDYTYGIKIVYLIKALVLVIHLFIYAVYRFDATFKRAFYAVFIHFFMNELSCLVYEITVFAELTLYIIAHLVIPYRIKI